MHIIYLHTCTITGKGYIGWTSMTLERRWVRHCYDARKGSESHFHRAIRLYGTEAWTHQTLQEGIETRKQAKEAEVIWIARLLMNRSDVGYNMTVGGDGKVGYKVSDETRQRLREARRRRAPVSEETRRRISESLKGHSCSLETREKIRQRRMGKGLNEESRMKVSRASRNRFQDPEFRAKHREATRKGMNREEKAS